MTSDQMVMAGAAIVDITPPAGWPMIGYAVRAEAATGAHAPLTARAIWVDDTAIVCVDVIGVDAGTVARIAARTGLDPDRLIVTALHTHGGPAAMPGRCGIDPEPGYVDRLVEGCAEAIEMAQRRRQPATLSHGTGADPRIAVNRRHEGGTVDTCLPVLRIQGGDGQTIAIMVSYACHPVVLGADNRRWTADYPGAVRRKLQEALPGAVAMFLTGCTGDANTGHSAHDSISVEHDPARTFRNAERIGGIIADRALQAACHPAGTGASGASDVVAMAFQRREQAPLPDLVEAWREEARRAAPPHDLVFDMWADWAGRFAGTDIKTMSVPGRVSVLQWGAVRVIGLPGEIFAQTAIDIRNAIGDQAAFVVGFAGDNPGYIAPAAEYPFGGYEVDEAHRYYGLPASFAEGTAEALARSAVALVGTLPAKGADQTAGEGS